MARTIPWLTVALLLLLAKSADASYITVLNQRIDRALYHAHGPREVLAGRIGEIRERDDGFSSEMFFHRDLDFHVEGVVLGDPARKGTILKLTSAHFEWPEVLVPFRTGAACILIVKPRTRDERKDAGILTVVPTARVAFEPLASRAAAMRELADLLLEQLDAEKNARRQRALLLQAVPVLEAKDAPRLEPFLESDAAWVRRAALSALAYATRSTAYVARAAKDLETFLQSTPADAEITVPEAQPLSGGARYAPYPLLFDHYLYLVTNWSEEERTTLGPMRPMFRVVARDLKGAEIQRWRHGIQPLCRLGVREDAKLLWAWGHTLREDPDHPLHTRTDVRFELLEGLSRILGIENEATQAHEVAQGHPVRTTLRGETEQLERIRKALAR